MFLQVIIFNNTVLIFFSIFTHKIYFKKNQSVKQAVGLLNDEFYCIVLYIVRGGHPENIQRGEQ